MEVLLDALDVLVPVEVEPVLGQRADVGVEQWLALVDGLGVGAVEFGVGLAVVALPRGSRRVVRTGREGGIFLSGREILLPRVK